MGLRMSSKVFYTVHPRCQLIESAITWQQIRNSNDVDKGTIVSLRVPSVCSVRVGVRPSVPSSAAQGTLLYLVDRPTVSSQPGIAYRGRCQKRMYCVLCTQWKWLGHSAGDVLAFPGHPVSPESELWDVELSYPGVSNTVWR
jgi:hypothetical protein